MMADLNQSRSKNHPDFWSKFYGAPCTDAHLYADVLRNLHNIFNDHRRPLTPEQEEAFSHARDSVINCAVHDFSSGRIEPINYAKHLVWAISSFEERLDPQTLMVRYVQPKGISPRWIFRVDGDIWTARGGSSFRCQISIDLEGRVSVSG